MREIIFKAKLKNWKEKKSEDQWVEGYYIKVEGKHFIITDGMICGNHTFLSDTGEFAEIDSETLCQYTGLTDKNDVKIWENDICYALLVKEDRENCIVRYGRRAENFKLELGFNLEWTKTNYLRCDICWWVENRELEVIGNIFDNPELLEE